MSDHKLARAWAAGEILTLTSPADRLALKKLVDDHDKLKQMLAVAEGALEFYGSVDGRTIQDDRLISDHPEYAGYPGRRAREAQAEIKKLRGE